MTRADVQIRMKNQAQLKQKPKRTQKNQDGRLEKKQYATTVLKPLRNHYKQPKAGVLPAFINSNPMYIIVWRNSHKGPFVDTEDGTEFSFLQAFSSKEAAEENAERTRREVGEKDPHYFDYQIYKEC